jgi:hypothetical protein
VVRQVIGEYLGRPFLKRIRNVCTTGRAVGAACEPRMTVMSRS